MSNLLSGEVVLDAMSGARVVWRDVQTGVVLTTLQYVIGDPNGVVSAEEGALAIGEAGTYQNTDGGMAWALLSTSGGGGGGPSYQFVVAPSAVQTGNVFTTLLAGLTAAQAQVATGGASQRVILFIAEDITSPGTGEAYDFTNLEVRWPR